MLDSLNYYLFDVWAEASLQPGAVTAQRHGAICRATVDDAVWIGHLKHKSDTELLLKLPATVTRQFTLVALQGNAGAGSIFIARGGQNLCA